jgi:glutathione synthase/RimK-type ligase-like ATP-grasp enzyme
MRAVDVLMPAAESDYAAMAVAEAEPYAAAFAARGWTLRHRPWTEGPGDGAATLALFAWGYHVDSARWAAVLAGWPISAPLFNPPALLRWNMRKTYLAELDAAGVPIVPSWFGDADAGSVAAAFDRFGVDTLVVKPQISGGSYRTDRVRRSDVVAPLADAIIQPFLPAIGDEGELSLLFIGGAFSHAVRKVAQAGDFRIQPQFGGVLSRAEAEPQAHAVAAQALAALPVAPLYARIDLIRLPGGGLALMELEAIEPDLYVDFGDDVPGKLADAVLGAIAQ